MTAANGDRTGGVTLSVEIFSDVVCPWCYIGARRFASAVDSLRHEASFGATIESVYRPFQLDPTARRDRAEPVIDVYARKFGGPERAAEMIASVTETAASVGLEFHLDRAVRANTTDAHRLLWFALFREGGDVQAALKESLMAAYFTDGENVADPTVLYERAVAAGVSSADTRRVVDSDEGLEAVAVGVQQIAAADLGIASVPTYVFDGQWAVPGAQEPAFFERALRRLAERAHQPSS